MKPGVPPPPPLPPAPPPDPAVPPLPPPALDPAAPGFRAVAAVVLAAERHETRDEETASDEKCAGHGPDDISPGASRKRRRAASTTASGASWPIAASRNNSLEP